MAVIAVALKDLLATVMYYVNRVNLRNSFERNTIFFLLFLYNRDVW